MDLKENVGGVLITRGTETQREEKKIKNTTFEWWREEEREGGRKEKMRRDGKPEKNLLVVFRNITMREMSVMKENGCEWCVFVKRDGENASVPILSLWLRCVGRRLALVCSPCHRPVHFEELPSEFFAARFGFITTSLLPLLPPWKGRRRRRGLWVRLRHCAAHNIAAVCQSWTFTH